MQELMRSLISKPFLYFVTPEISEDLYTWIHLVKEAVLGGASFVQIRDKTNSARRVIEAAKGLQPFLKEQKAYLMINDRVDIAHAVQADGVHLGQSDLRISEARALLGPSPLIGLSLENMEQLEGAKGADYVAASPLFHTATKEDIATPWGLEGLKRLRASTSLPLVVIGGIKPSHVQEILNTGVQGIAVISAIASHPDPREAARNFALRICDEAAGLHAP